MVRLPRQLGRCYIRNTAVVLLVTLVYLTMAVGCSKPVISIPPYIPPAYYNCTEVTPQVLCDAYYLRYANIAEAEYRFNTLFFVFKNVKVTALMFKHLDEGYFWVDNNLVQCYCLCAKDLKHYKIGDTIDIVGQNEGPIAGITGLVFRDCIILPTGFAQLPAPGGENVLVPTY